MLPDNTPVPPSDPDLTKPEVEPIAPEAAARILEQALTPYLADDWRVIDRSAYAARLTRGMRNIDIRVGLLGEVDMEESGLTPVQDSGRLMAWVLLLASLLVVLALASALGII